MDGSADGFQEQSYELKHISGTLQPRCDTLIDRIQGSAIGSDVNVEETARARRWIEVAEKPTTKKGKRSAS